jgi:polyisoprenoid-binding protein YceI
MNRIRAIAAMALALLASQSLAQGKYFTKSGFIQFYASSSVEKIEATNEKGTCVLDSKTGAVEMQLLMKAFTFDRALMQEHFNENYVESDKYPKSTFKGIISNMSDVDLSKDGAYAVKVTGTLTIHGVTKTVTPKAKLIVKAGKVNATASFNILLADYGIDIPGVVADKISKTVKIDTNMWLDALK